MKGRQFPRDNDRIITAKEIAEAAGIHRNTLFYNVKMLKLLLGDDLND